MTAYNVTLLAQHVHSRASASAIKGVDTEGFRRTIAQYVGMPISTKISSGTSQYTYQE